MSELPYKHVREFTPEELALMSRTAQGGLPLMGFPRLRDQHEEVNQLDSILLEAEALTEGARQASYGSPLDDYTRTAKLWSAILGHEVTAEQAILCMVAVKISRECHRAKRDNRVDGAGYFKCLDMVEQERARRNSTPANGDPRK